VQSLQNTNDNCKLIILSVDACLVDAELCAAQCSAVFILLHYVNAVGVNIHGIAGNACNGRCVTIGQRNILVGVACCTFDSVLVENCGLGDNYIADV
ncbi:MAG: hypothetical protein U0K87_09365, partial [Ruminococcus sp.]|nr:hypothetical protein [Ruminococcus sp.]